MRGVAVLALLTGLAGCDRKTVLVLEALPDSDLRPELRRLFRLMHVDEDTPVDAAGSRLRAVWPTSLPEDTRLRLRQNLDRAVALDAVGVPVRFELVVTEDNPRVLEGLGLSPAKLRYPLAFELYRGDLHLKTGGSDTIPKELCTWDVPLTNAVPSLTYGVAPPPEANPADPRVALMQTLSQMVLTAKHQTLATPGALQGLADDVRYHDEANMSFVFDEKRGLYTPQLGALLLGSSYSACADTILDRAADDFFRVVLFPELARGIMGYEIADRVFVGDL